MGYITDLRHMEFYKKTSDNWNSNFNIVTGESDPRIPTISLVRVRVFSLSRMTTRIYISGTDDYAYFKDYNTDDLAQAEITTILKMDLVNIENLTQLGFIFF